MTESIISKGNSCLGSSVDPRVIRIQAITDSIEGNNLRLVLPGSGVQCIVKAVKNHERNLCEKILFQGLPIAAAASALATYMVYMCWHFGTWTNNNKNGPTPFPILGNWSYKLKGQRMDDIDMQRRMLYGDIYGVYEPREPLLVISNPILIKELLIDFDKYLLHSSQFQNKHQPESTLNNITNDKNWKLVRRTMKGLLCNGRMKEMRSSLEAAGKNIGRNLKETMEKYGKIDMKLIAHHYAIDLIARIGFGIELDSFADPTNEFILNFAILLQYSKPECRCRITLKHFFPFLEEQMNKLNESKLPSSCKRYFVNLVSNEAYEPKLKSGNLLKDMAELTRISHDPEIKPCHHWISKGFTKEEIAAQLMFFIQNSYAPIVSSLALICFYITEYPGVQAEIIREIDAILKFQPGCGEDIKEKGLYLDSVLNEVLRLHPPAVRIERICVHDFTLSDGTRIDKDMIIRIPTKTVHTDKDLWENALQFDPNRFNGDTIINSNRSIKFLPFGGGERSCMGESLAREAISCGIIYVLLNNQLATFSPLDVTPRMDDYGNVESGFVLRKARVREVLTRTDKCVNPNADEVSVYSTRSSSSRRRRRKSKSRSSRASSSNMITEKNSEHDGLAGNENVVSVSSIHGDVTPPNRDVPDYGSLKEKAPCGMEANEYNPESYVSKTVGGNSESTALQNKFYKADSGTVYPINLTSKSTTMEPEKDYNNESTMMAESGHVNDEPKSKSNNTKSGGSGGSGGKKKASNNESNKPKDESTLLRKSITSNKITFADNVSVQSDRKLEGENTVNNTSLTNVKDTGSVKEVEGGQMDNSQMEESMSKKLGVAMTAGDESAGNSAVTEFEKSVNEASGGGNVEGGENERTIMSVEPNVDGGENVNDLNEDGTKKSLNGDKNGEDDNDASKVLDNKLEVDVEGGEAEKSLVSNNDITDKGSIKMEKSNNEDASNIEPAAQLEVNVEGGEALEKSELSNDKISLNMDKSKDATISNMELENDDDNKNKVELNADLSVNVEGGEAAEQSVISNLKNSIKSNDDISNNINGGLDKKEKELLEVDVMGGEAMEKSQISNVDDDTTRISDIKKDNDDDKLSNNVVADLDKLSVNVEGGELFNDGGDEATKSNVSDNMKKTKNNNDNDSLARSDSLKRVGGMQDNNSYNADNSKRSLGSASRRSSIPRPVKKTNSVSNKSKEAGGSNSESNLKID